jgi:hypothetical protein
VLSLVILDEACSGWRPRLTPIADLVVQVAAVVLMLTGAALLLMDLLDESIAIPVIAVGIALVAVRFLPALAARYPGVSVADRFAVSFCDVHCFAEVGVEDAVDADGDRR